MLNNRYKKDILKVFENVRNNQEYDFLRKDKHLGNNIIMLGLGGSYAYGTYNENSDVDIRGIARNTREEILLGRDFEQVVDIDTDTTIYSLTKIINLLTSNNPNTMEILGLEDEQLLYTSDLWEIVRQEKDIFLSKRVVHTFGGYASQQLRRLETKSARIAGQSRKEEYIYSSIINAEETFKQNCAKLPDDSLRLFLDYSDKEEFEKEIFIDVNVSHYPLRDFSSLISNYHQVVRTYDKVGVRNKKAIEHNRLSKHMMHLVRLYHMAFDILENGIIKTYRDKDHDFLMEIRNGKYLDENRQVLPEFYEIVEEYDERLKQDAKKSELPENPDREKIDKVLIRLNEMIVQGM